MTWFRSVLPGPAGMGRIVTALAALVLSSQIATAACIDVRDPSALVFEGQLTHAVLPGPPNWVDIGKGDEPESTYILELVRPICATGDEFIEANVSIARVQVYAPDEAGEAKLRGLVGRSVVVVGESAFGAHTGHHRAPLVVSVASLRAAEGGAGATTDAAEATVRAFYAALAAADGNTASRYVIPEKRAAGPFSPSAISHFYGSLTEPLRLVSVERGSDGYLVRYTYVAPGGRRCDGRAALRLVRRDGVDLIEAIRALDGC